MRVLPLLLLVATLATGCTARQRMVVGGAAIASGLLMAAQPVEESWTICAPGECKTLSDAFLTSRHEDRSLQDAGVALVVTGIVLAIHGAATMSREDRDEARAAEVARQQAALEARATARRAAVAKPTAPPPPPPSVEARLAMQASLIAKTGNCDGARATALRLAEIDADAYARLLLTDEAVAHCSKL